MSVDLAPFGELPTTDQEIWRYSRIDQLDPARYTPAAHAPAVEGPDGIAVVGAASAVVDEAPDVFAAANVDLVQRLGGQVTVTVPAGRTVEEPIVVTHTIAADGALVAPRLVIDAGADSEVTVIEWFLSEGSGDSLAVPVVQIRAAAAARVNYVTINELSTDAWSIGHQQAIGERDSTISLSTITLGGDYARVRTDVRAVGAGASTRQVALYFATGNQMHDFRTIQDHDAPNTNSDLLFKGAVQDSAASVYTGTIAISENAPGSVAYQTNRNLTLSDGAWAESVPNLDIRTNDVQCSHASTIGPIDEDQRFYLESRGVRPATAERLVVMGFFDEVLALLPVGAGRSHLRELVAAKLNIGEETP